MKFKKKIILNIILNIIINIIINIIENKITYNKKGYNAKSGNTT